MLGLIPTEPTITTQVADNGVLTALCVDADTERMLQRQRIFAMLGSPLLVYAGAKVNGPMWLKGTIMAMGGLCFYAHLSAYRAVAPYMKPKKSQSSDKEPDNATA